MYIFYLISGIPNIGNIVSRKGKFRPVPSSLGHQGLAAIRKVEIEPKKSSAQLSKSQVPTTASDQERRNTTQQVFKGLMVPVFTCFKSDEAHTLDVRHIDQYAKYLRAHNVKGVIVNTITGEGPALGLFERKKNAEVWWEATKKYDLVCMLQIGGAPLPEVMELAQHAQELGVHAVVCLPELYYKPRNIEQLVGYCKIIASFCPNLPFLYFHIPKWTNVEYDMCEFCGQAENAIPNFVGLNYSSSNLEEGSRCLRDGRIIMLGQSTLLACGLLLGFETVAMPALNICPDLGWDIYKAMEKDDLDNAKEKQLYFNELVRVQAGEHFDEGWVGLLKEWFNEKMSNMTNGFTAGPTRRFF